MKKVYSFIVSVLLLQFAFAQTPPVAVNDTFTTNKNISVTFYVLANDYDIDGDPLSITILTAPSHGTASVNGNNINYVPVQNYSGSDSLVYVICDTTNRCDTATVYITITANNNPPVAENDNYTIPQNTATVFAVLSNDYDADGEPLTVTLLTPPANGTATVNGGQVTYTPNNNYTGTDSFVYVICDTTNTCDTATVFITITNTNNFPVAVNDNYTILQNTTTTLPALSNDYDADGDVLTVTVLTPPANGTVTVNGTQFTYVPATNYTGTDSFVYVICDITGLCDTATVYIIITGNNTVPVALDDVFAFGDTLSSLSLDLLSNDNDANGDSIFVAAVFDIDSANNLGNVTITSTGEVDFTRTELACGTETFQYVLCDYAFCDTASLTITITCPEDIFHTQGFSPDGDGLNDKLVFTGLEYFAPASIRVYNRYGSQVFESDEYQNDWDGTYKNGPLPDGTYFYVLQLANGKKYNDYLVINR